MAEYGLLRSKHHFAIKMVMLAQRSTWPNDYLVLTLPFKKVMFLIILRSIAFGMDGNKPSNVLCGTSTLNYTMFPFWTAQKLSSNSRGYYVDQTSTTGLFIIGWYSWQLYSSTNTSNYEIVLNYNTNAIEFRYGSIPSIDNSFNNRAIGLTGDLSTSGCTGRIIMLKL